MFESVTGAYDAGTASAEHGVPRAQPKTYRRPFVLQRFEPLG